MESLHLAIAIADRENTEKVIETFRESNVFTTDIVLGTGTRLALSPVLLVPGLDP